MSKKSSVENPKGKKKKPAQSVTPLRRSSRLSGKYTPLYAPHYSLNSAVYSRSSLGQNPVDSYSSASVLNESGQSVPLDFDQDNDVVRHDHSYSRGPSRDDHTRQLNVSAGSLHATLDDIRESTPSLYGLDCDDDELSQLRDYDLYTKERILTPPKSRAIPFTRSSYFGSGIIEMLYRLGSMLYLVFAIIVLCDITIFSRCAAVFGRYFKVWPQNVGFFLLLFGFFFIATTAPHVKYTAPPKPISPVSLPTPAVIATTDNLTVLNDVISLRKEFNIYKEEQRELLDKLKMMFLDNLNESADEMSALQSRFQAIVEAEVKKEKQERKAMNNSLLEKIANELASNTKVFDVKLRNLKDNIDKLSSSAERNMSDVQLVEHQALNKAMADLKSSVELKIQEITAALQEMQKDQDQSALSSQVKELDKKIGLFNVKMSEQLESNKNMESRIERKTLREEELGKLSKELNELSKKLSDIEKAMQNITAEVKGYNSSGGIAQETVIRLISEALDAYNADQIAKFDFALESAGGQVVDSSDTFDSSNTKAQLFGFTLPITLSRTFPAIVIQPAVFPGDCWCFKGSEGYVTIKLSSGAVVSGVTVQHLPKVLSPTGTITSAIRSFSVKGLNVLGDEGVNLGTFEYNSEGPYLQQFAINNKDKAFTHIKFVIMSNHGNLAYTCIYRLRVHGTVSTG